MMKTPIVLLILFSHLILVSCLTQKRCNEKFPPTTSVIHDSSYIVQRHDSIIHVLGDSTYFRLFLECLNGKPVIQAEENKSTKQYAPLHEQAQVNYSLKNSVLQVNCKCDSEAIYLHWYNKTIKVRDSISKVTAVTTNVLTFYQKLFIKLGWLFIFLVLAIIVYFYVHLKNQLHEI